MVIVGSDSSELRSDPARGTLHQIAKVFHQLVQVLTICSQQCWRDESALAQRYGYPNVNLGTRIQFVVFPDGV